MFTITDRLQRQALLYPQKKVFSYVSRNETGLADCTFQQLDEMARAVAGRLQEMGQPGDRVALLFPSGLEFIAGFLGTLYAGMIAVPLYVPRKNKLSERIHLVMADCTPSIVFTTEKTGEHLQKNFPGLADGPATLLWEDAIAKPASYKPFVLSEDAVAFLQYTSGSTGQPKGVMVLHRNIMANLQDLYATTGQSENTVMVSWLPVFHDLGLITGILLPIYSGSVCYLMSPVDFITRPLSWPLLLSETKATHTVAPNFAFNLCLKAIEASSQEDLNLSSLMYLGNCAEPVQWSTVQDFAETFAAYGLQPGAIKPGYGLAEATLKVTTTALDEAPFMISLDADALSQQKIKASDEESRTTRQTVSCGQPYEGTSLKIVDPSSGQLCNENEIGEVCIQGPAVTAGYWNDEARTQSAFQPITENGDIFLKTGDAGFLRDGNLYITGRYKDLLILNGSNHFPQDIEWTVSAASAAIRKDCVAAFALQDDNELVIVAELQSDYAGIPDAGAIYSDISIAVSKEHELLPRHIVLIKPSTLPKTSSGKVQRSETRRLFMEGGLSVMAQSGAIEKKSEEAVAAEDELCNQVVAIARELLQIEYISAQHNLYLLGFNSIRAMQLMHAMEERLDIPLPVSLIFEVETLQQLSGRIAKIREELKQTASISTVNNTQGVLSEADIDGLSEQALDELLSNTMASSINKTI